MPAEVEPPPRLPAGPPKVCERCGWRSNPRMSQCARCGSPLRTRWRVPESWKFAVALTVLVGGCVLGLQVTYAGMVAAFGNPDLEIVANIGLGILALSAAAGVYLWVRRPPPRE